MSKRFVEEAKHLLIDARVPLTKISKRLTLSVPLLKRIIDSDDVASNPLRDRRARVLRFYKISDRARNLLSLTLKNSKTPMILRNL